MQTMKKMSMAAASLTTLVSSASGRVAAFWSKSCTVPHMFNSLGPCMWMNNSISVAAHLVAILAVLVEDVGDHLGQVGPVHSFNHILVTAASNLLLRESAMGTMEKALRARVMTPIMSPPVRRLTQQQHLWKQTILERR